MPQKPTTPQGSTQLKPGAAGYHTQQALQPNTAAPGGAPKNGAQPQPPQNTAPAGQGGKQNDRVTPPPGGFQSRPTAPVQVTGAPAAPSQQQQQIYTPQGQPSHTFRQGDTPRSTQPNTAPPGGTPKGSEAAAAPPPGYSDALKAQFGADNPFGQRSFYGGNPLETAMPVAREALGQELAQLRARYGASGLGNSSRLALAEGQALGDFGTQLGDTLAQRGEQAYQNDASRGLQAFLGATSAQQNANAQAMQANQQLGGLGTGLTGIGAQEQAIPNLEGIGALLGAFQSIMGSGNNNSRGASGFGFKR